jgi:hypothetical protein
VNALITGINKRKFFIFVIKYLYYKQTDAKVNHVRWVYCHNGMARPQVADGGDGLQTWRVAANILNKQSRTTDRGWFSIWGVGHGAKNFSP